MSDLNGKIPENTFLLRTLELFSPFRIDAAQFGIIKEKVDGTGKYKVVRVSISSTKAPQKIIYCDMLTKDYDVIRAIKFINPDALINVTYDENRREAILSGVNPK